MTDIKYDTMQDKLAGQRVMLVGGAGFIGHNLALELRRLGVETMVVDNLMVNSLIENVFDVRRQSVALATPIRASCSTASG